MSLNQVKLDRYFEHFQMLNSLFGALLMLHDDVLIAMVAGTTSVCCGLNYMTSGKSIEFIKVMIKKETPSR